MVAPTLVGKQAETQGGIQWSTSEIKTQMNDPVSGKPIYRKLVNFGALPATATKNVAHGIANLNVADGAYIWFECIITTGTAVTHPGDTTSVTSHQVNATNCQIITGADLSGSTAMFRIEYTKT